MGNKLLRLLRSDAIPPVPLTDSQKADQEDVYGVAQKGIGAAILEAEYRKAEAVMTLERRRGFL